MSATDLKGCPHMCGHLPINKNKISSLKKGGFAHCPTTFSLLHLHCGKSQPAYLLWCLRRKPQEDTCRLVSGIAVRSHWSVPCLYARHSLVISTLRNANYVIWDSGCSSFLVFCRIAKAILDLYISSCIRGWEFQLLQRGLLRSL